MLRFGACYHPEQWTPEQATDHVKLMVKSRMNTVRMGENCWCKFEPEQGRYKFDWLDPIVEALDKEKISIVLCTPTAIAPLWVHVRHPNVRRLAAGQFAQPGTRHACCVNAPEFQILTDAIVQNLARHYGKASGVIAWQIDSELSFSPADPCRCEHCLKAFRAWLLARYETTDRLNEAWHNAASGADVRQWNEVVFPSERLRMDWPAGAALDFKRFSSDSLISYHKRQADIIRGLCPGHQVVSKLTAEADVDVSRLREQVDAPASETKLKSPWDRSDSFELARMRGQKKKIWVVEQRFGDAEDTVELGAIRRNTWQSIAHGAELVLLYPFRTAVGGAESAHIGVLDWDGVPRRRFKEAALIGEELRKLGGEINGTAIEAKVAMVYSADADWSASHPFTTSLHITDCRHYFEAVRRTGNACDVIDPEISLDQYTVVIAAGLTILDNALAQRFEAFVKRGGTLIISRNSGAREINNAHIATPLPGLLASLAGITIEEYAAPNKINFARGSLIAEAYESREACEVLEVVDAESLAEYLDGRLKGKTAISRRGVGNGQVIYIGVHLDRILDKFLADFLPDFPIKDIPPEVDVVQRSDKNKRLVFIVNNHPERRELTLPAQFPDLLTGETVGPKLTISANGILILKAQG